MINTNKRLAGKYKGGKCNMARKWKIIKVDADKAIYKSYGMTIVIRNAMYDPGCYDLRLINRKGETIKTAFWHGQDAEIPGDEQERIAYFSAPDFPECLNWVEWEDVPTDE